MPVFLQIKKKMHVQQSMTKILKQCSNTLIKNDQYREKEIAQANLENAVCSAMGESIYIKHMNSVSPL